MKYVQLCMRNARFFRAQVENNYALLKTMLSYMCSIIMTMTMNENSFMFYVHTVLCECVEIVLL